MHEVVLKRFETPDEVRMFEKGKFELVHIGGMTIGRATYSPAGNGQSMWASPWGKPAAKWSMWGW